MENQTHNPEETEHLPEESENEESLEDTEAEATEEECSSACDSENKDACIAELEEKLKAYEDKYIRVHADFDNIKKRLEREKTQMIEYASEQFARDLLPVIDSLEMALSSAQNDEADTAELLEKIKEGIGLTIDNFKKSMGKHGVEEIGTAQGFDPHLHEAVMQVNSEEHEDGAIVQMLQKGYKYKERILRPAMVSINRK